MSHSRGSGHKKQLDNIVLSGSLKCKACMHSNERVTYCRAYQASLELINPDKCKRHKTKPSKKFKKKSRRKENNDRTR